MTRTLFLLFSLLVLLTPAAHATEKQVEENLIVSAPVEGDLYAAGGTVVIKQRVVGDVIVVGGTVEILGNVAEDLFAAGGTVHIDGDIGDDARIVAGEVSLRGDIGEDLIIFGGTVRIEPDTLVRGELHVYGGDLTLRGTVRGNLEAVGGRITLDGVAENGVNVQGEEIVVEGQLNGTSTLVAQKIRISEQAQINSSFRYWTPDRAIDLEIPLEEGIAVYDPNLEPNFGDHAPGVAKRAMFFSALFSFTGLLTALIVISILVLVLKTFFTDTTKLLLKNRITCLLCGLLYFFATPVLAIFLFATLIGIPFALMIAAIYLFTIYLALPITATVFMDALGTYYKKKWGKLAKIGIALAIFIALKVLMIIPFVGWVVCAILVFAAFGAILLVKGKRLQKML